MEGVLVGVTHSDEFVQSLRAIVADLTDECSGSGISLDVAEEGYRWRKIEMMY